jgi:hypothetical protein
LCSDLFAATPDGGVEVREASLARLLEGFGGAPEEAEALAAGLTPVELQWLASRGVHAFTHAGKVVGVNYTGLLVLLLPILVAVIVAAVAGQSAAGLALGALAVGLLFVLLVEPRFIFGEKTEID